MPNISDKLAHTFVNSYRTSVWSVLEPDHQNHPCGCFAIEVVNEVIALARSLQTPEAEEDAVSLEQAMKEYPDEFLPELDFPR